MSSESKNSKDPNLTKEEQEQASAQKAGELAGRAALDYATGGKYEQIRNAPVVGAAAKKAEEKIGDKVGKIDKATGGKIGKIAKKADDAGALDAADKGLGALGGKGPKPNADSLNASKAPHPVSAPDTSTSKQNFAKDGISDNNGSNIVPHENNISSADRKKLDDINSRKNEAKEKNLDTGKDETEEKGGSGKEFLKSDNKVINIAVQQMAKQILVPFFAFMLGLIIISSLIIVYNNDNDLSAVDTESEEYNGGETNYYSSANPQVQEFYDRVVAAEERYSKNGKKISTLYLTGTYHILKQYKNDISIKELDDDLINEMCNGMLGNSSVYSEASYKTYLEETFFPAYDFSENKSKTAAKEVFEYINQYLEKHNRTTSCSSVSGGSCEYSFTGVHGLNVGAFTVSDLHVRLMSSSFCNGTDNVALKEDLVPFEKYILGVTYGEIGQAFNTEVEKVHMIASRSFALARPYAMNGSSGVKYITEGNQSIVQLRSCVADQVFCNPDQGCSKDVPAGDQYGVVYSGKTHPHVYKDELSNYPNSTLKSSWEETMGMVGVDKDGKVVEMGYYTGNGNKDDWVWKRWAEQGMDYVQIIMSAYPEIKEIKKFDCNKSIQQVESNFLQTASAIWKQIANGGYSYSMSGVSVPPSGSYIDCSSFVSWVLYEYGFKDEFGGGQHNTVAFLNTNWSEKMGWTEIPVAANEDVSAKVQPGDILVRDTGAGGANGHINIIAEVTEDGRVLAFDCGDSSNWNNATAREGKPVDRTSFAKSDYRAGKIIRVSNVSGNSCKSAESGEWQTWRQYAPAPWAHVPLGNSGRDIGGYGCFVTSIAIQIARSGAQTTLSEFNPGTFVQELNKYGSFDGYGNFVGGGNISKIVPSFEFVDTAVSLPGDKAGKISTIKSYIDQGYYVILRVKTSSGQHWVAVTGVTNDGIQMVDPGSDATMVWDQYPVSESSTINVYKIG